jgi:hypothetical protein
VEADVLWWNPWKEVITQLSGNGRLALEREAYNINALVEGSSGADVAVSLCDDDEST